jgi:hypothetical protein
MRTWERIAPGIGLVAIALIVAAFIVGGDPPDADAPGAEVVSFYESDDTEVGVGSTLLALGAAAFVLFTVLLATRLRAAAGRVSATANGTLVGGALMGVGMLIFAGIGLTLSDVGGDLEPAATQALNALSEDMFFPVAGGTVVFTWSVALAILRHGGLPRWLGWVAVVIAVASVTPAGFFAFLAIGIWTAIVSAVLLANPETAQRAPA